MPLPGFGALFALVCFCVYPASSQWITVLINEPIRQILDGIETGNRSLREHLTLAQTNWPTPFLDPVSIDENDNISTVFRTLCRALEKRPFFMAGSLTPKLSRLIDSFMRRFGIPYLTWDDAINLRLDLLSESHPSKSQEAEFTNDSLKEPPINNPSVCRVFSLRPDLTQPLIDFLAFWRWKRFAYLYATQDAFQRMEAVTLELFKSINADQFLRKPYSVLKALKNARLQSDNEHQLFGTGSAPSDEDEAEDDDLEAIGREDFEEDLAADEIQPCNEERFEAYTGPDDTGKGGIRFANLDIDTGYIDPDNGEVMQRTLKKIDRRLGRRKRRRIIIDLGSSGLFDGASSRDRFNRVFDWLSRFGMLRAEYHYVLVDLNILDLSLAAYKASRVNITGFYLLDYGNGDARQMAQFWPGLANASVHDKAFLSDTLKSVVEVHSSLKSAYNQLRDLLPKYGPSCYPGSLRADDTGAGLRPPTGLVTGPTWTGWPLDREVTRRLVSAGSAGLTGRLTFDPATCKRRGHRLVLTQFSGQGGAVSLAQWSLERGWMMQTSELTSPPAPPALREDGAGAGAADSAAPSRAQFDQTRALDKPSKGMLSQARRLNQSIRVVTILSPPFVMYSGQARAESKTGRRNFDGYCIDLADRIFTNLSLTYDLHLVKDGVYGEYFEQTRTWNGMIGELLRGEADVAIAPMTMTSMRAKFVGFTEPFMNFGLSVMLRKPGNTKPGTFSFLSPLTNNLWLCVVTASLAVALGLRGIAAISPYEKARTDDTGGFTAFNSLWFAFASFVHQGIDIFPLSPGARIVSSIWRFFCLLIMAYYTANLAAALSVERLISPINSIKDLVEKRELGIRVGMLNSGSTKEFFRNSTDKIYSSIFQELERDKSSYAATTQEGTERVRTGSYAFIVESKMNEYINHRRPCNTMLVGSVFGSKAYAVAVPANSFFHAELRDRITDAILLLREDQVLAKLYKEWWIEKGECIETSESSKSQSLALVNLSGAFYILIVGLVLAMLTGMNLFVYELRQRRRKKCDLDKFMPK